MANHFQMFHYIAIITGVVLFVLNFVNFAEILYEIKSLFNLAVFGIIASGAMMLYATDTAFHMSCKFASSPGINNVIEANDEIRIVIMLLDLLSACLLFSAAFSFVRTY